MDYPSSSGQVIDDHQRGTAGVVLQFHDDGETASLASSLGRWQAQWLWYRAAAQEGNPPEAMMVLDSGNRLRLQDPQAPNDPPGVLLDPAAQGPAGSKAM